MRGNKKFNIVCRPGKGQKTGCALQVILRVTAGLESSASQGRNMDSTYSRISWREFTCLALSTRGFCSDLESLAKWFRISECMASSMVKPMGSSSLSIISGHLASCQPSPPGPSLRGTSSGITSVASDSLGRSISGIFPSS